MPNIFEGLKLEQKRNIFEGLELTEEDIQQDEFKFKLPQLSLPKYQPPTYTGLLGGNIPRNRELIDHNRVGQLQATPTEDLPLSDYMSNTKSYQGILGGNTPNIEQQKPAEDNFSPLNSAWNALNRASAFAVENLTGMPGSTQRPQDFVNPNTGPQLIHDEQGYPTSNNSFIDKASEFTGNTAAELFKFSIASQLAGAGAIGLGKLAPSIAGKAATIPGQAGLKWGTTLTAKNALEQTMSDQEKTPKDYAQGFASGFVGGNLGAGVAKGVQHLPFNIPQSVYPFVEQGLAGAGTGVGMTGVDYAFNPKETTVGDLAQSMATMALMRMIPLANKDTRNIINKARQQIIAPVLQQKEAQKEALNTLGLKSGATAQDINQAYKSQSKTMHPDVGGSESEFMKLNQARENALNLVNRSSLTDSLKQSARQNINNIWETFRRKFSSGDANIAPINNAQQVNNQPIPNITQIPSNTTPNQIESSPNIEPTTKNIFSNLTEQDLNNVGEIETPELNIQPEIPSVTPKPVENIGNNDNTIDTEKYGKLKVIKDDPSEATVAVENEAGTQFRIGRKKLQEMTIDSDGLDNVTAEQQIEQQPVNPTQVEETDNIDSDRSEAWQLPRDEYIKTITTRTDTKPAKSFDEFIEEKGYKKSDLPTDLDYANLIGGVLTETTTAGKGKLKQPAEKIALNDKLHEEYKKEISKGNIGQKEISRSIENNEADEAYKRIQHKREIKKALNEGKNIPEEVLKDYPDLQSQEANKIINDRDHYTIERVDQEPFVVGRGDIVDYSLGKGKNERGIVKGISHANKQIAVVSTDNPNAKKQWFDYGFIYPATEIAQPKNPEKSSESIDKVNKTNAPEGGFDESNRVSSDLSRKEKYRTNEFISLKQPEDMSDERYIEKLRYTINNDSKLSASDFVKYEDKIKRIEGRIKRRNQIKKKTEQYKKYNLDRTKELIKYAETIANLSDSKSKTTAYILNKLNTPGSDMNIDYQKSKFNQAERELKEQLKELGYDSITQAQKAIDNNSSDKLNELTNKETVASSESKVEKLRTNKENIQKSIDKSPSNLKEQYISELQATDEELFQAESKLQKLKNNIVNDEDYNLNLMPKELQYSIDSKGNIPENTDYESAKDEWFGNKDWAVVKNSVEADSIQDAIKNTVEKGQSWREIDRAIQVYIDTLPTEQDPNRTRRLYDKYYNQLDTKKKRIVKVSQNLTDEQKAIAQYILKSDNQMGLAAKDADVIQNVRENHLSRFWKNDNKKGITGMSKKFSPKTGLRKARTLDSVLEGWSNGKELRVTGASNSLQTMKDEIVRTIEDKKLIKELQNTESPDGNNIISNIQHEGYERIEHPNFRTWKVVDQVDLQEKPLIEGNFHEGDKVRVKETGKIGRISADRETGNVLVTFKDGELEQTEIYPIDELIKVLPRGQNMFISDEGLVYERQNLYAPEGIAKNLNNILGTSSLYEIPGVEAITKANAFLKSVILQSSFFHHIAYTTSYLWGTHGKTLREWNPKKAYKDGLKAVKALDEDIELLVRNGLTIGKIQDWEELSEIANAAQGKEGSFRRKMTDFLFKKFGAGLKAQAALIEYRYMLKKHPELRKDERAKMVANLINDDFGGLHLGRMGRNPTTQHALRLGFLAPDWSESNFRTMLKTTLKKINGEKLSKIERKMYRKFWTGIFAKSMGATLIANLLISLFDDKDFLERYEIIYNKARKSGSIYQYLNLLDVDVTPIYRALGEDKKTRKYISLIGHFKDPIKFITMPMRSLKNKSSIIGGAFLNAMTGTDWKGQRYTHIKDVFEEGFTEWRWDSGPISWSELPSFVANELSGFTPLQIQNIVSLLTGEMDAWDSILKSLGLRTSSMKE